MTTCEGDIGTVGVRELKQDASRILRRVREEGESFNITYHGRVIARIVPMEDPESNLRSLDEFLVEWDALEAIHESRGRLE